MNFLLLLGLLLFKGDSSADAHQVVTSAGQHVFLPCSVKISAGDDFPTVEWSRKDLQPDVVFLYRDGCETFEMKNLDYEYRTSLIMREVKNGNVSLRISNVKLSDAGTYQCLKILKNGTREQTSVELVVVAASDLKVALVPADTRGVTVECEASCWWPLPQMVILDAEGNNITTEDPKEEETGGCFNVKLRVMLQKHSSRVVCRGYQLMTNHSRTVEIFIPDHWMRSGLVVVGVSAAVMLFLCLAVFTSLFLSKHNCIRCAGCNQTPGEAGSDQRTSTDPSKLLQKQLSVADENTTNGLIEANLTSVNYQKSGNILKLQDGVV